MILAIISCLVFSVYYYVEAFKSALPAKKWALAGLMFGPMILPMFSISQRVALRQSRGFNNSLLRV
ncbi:MULTISPECIES: hypothetical protein [Alteromonadaceae]|uniref:hypothetical protein n=1 Tax=Alteromonadaceae TaxID=72275 RepID=UPI001C085EEA|nr:MULTISPECIES: hypothetical protein [Aliiglaciecola]MBU2878048.1 hypothetical protein [Aliiglaciecola lipolytica]MDO6709413.1 hypothetical protein [Aliiglaciecola sp. 2_MG-2023]MDO6750561.1 hypothetical protein [Aliiglaciecola sp. 1_MG-2023]